MGEKMHNEGIIRPVKGKRDPRLAPDVLMVMMPSELKCLARLAEAEKTVFSDMRLYDLYRESGACKTPIALAGPFLGAPHAVMGLEKLIALGAERVLVLGWCGSLMPSLKIGDLVIPTHAVSEEGTSQHYPLPSKIPSSDPWLNQILEGALKEKEAPFTKGAIWTTDAVYRETPEKVRAYQQQNILAVEMEMSALMTVSSYRSVQLAALLVVSDELFELKWRPGFSNQRLKTRSRWAAELLLGVHKSLADTEILHGEMK